MRNWTVICWLLELPKCSPVLYLHPARGRVCGFTPSAHDAQQFATRAAVEAERDALNGALGAVPVEHAFV